jgi:hypothetical protein
MAFIGPNMPKTSQPLKKRWNKTEGTKHVREIGISITEINT